MKKFKRIIWEKIIKDGDVTHYIADYKTWKEMQDSKHLIKPIGSVKSHIHFGTQVSF